MKRIEIAYCCDCGWFQKSTLTTARKCIKENREIDYPSAYSDHFPGWCPLPDVKNEPKNAEDHIWKPGDINA
jgi:hypothetical protein